MFLKLHFDGAQRIELSFHYHDAKDSLVLHQVIYTQEQMLCRRVVPYVFALPGAPKRDPREAVMFGSVVKVAIEDLSHLIDNSNLTIAELNLTIRVPLYQAGREFISGIQSVLLKIQKLKVESFTFTGRQEEILKILPHLEPGTLKELLIQPRYAKEIEHFLRQISGLEQWKMLRSFTMSSVADYPFKYWCDFPVTNMIVRSFNLQQIHEALEVCYY